MFPMALFGMRGLSRLLTQVSYRRLICCIRLLHALFSHTSCSTPTPFAPPSHSEAQISGRASRPYERSVAWARLPCTHLYGAGNLESARKFYTYMVIFTERSLFTVFLLVNFSLLCFVPGVISDMIACGFFPPPEQCISPSSVRARFYSFSPRRCIKRVPGEPISVYLSPSPHTWAVLLAVSLTD